MEFLRTRKEQSSTGTMQQPNKHAIFCDKAGIRNSAKDPQKQYNECTIFCCKVGIKKCPQKQLPNTSDVEANAAYRMEAVDGGFYKKVLNAYEWKVRQRRFIVTIIHILQLLQIIFGATATAISASKVPTIMVTVLAAIVTVVAGILAFIRGHLDGIRRLQNDLREVCDHISFKEMEYRLCDTTEEVATEDPMAKDVKDVTVKEVKDDAAKDVMVKEVNKVMEEVKRLYDNAVKGDKTSA